MGSGASRGKRVAPARVSESEARAISRINARNRSQQERQSCRSEGRDLDPNCCSSSSSSSSARDGDAIDGDADTAAAADEQQQQQQQSWACVKRSPSSHKKKKKKKKSRSYGLCRSRQDDEESSVEEPRAFRDVNKRAFLHVRKQTAAPSGHMTSSSQAFLTQEVPLEAVPTPQRKPTLSTWQNSSLTPVILYDGSEEELMDTIEREFS